MSLLKKEVVLTTDETAKYSIAIYGDQPIWEGSC